MNLQMSPKNNAILWLGSPSWIPPSLTLQIAFLKPTKIDALENNQLPAEIPATLRVSFELTPGEDGFLQRLDRDNPSFILVFRKRFT